MVYFVRICFLVGFVLGCVRVGSIYRFFGLFFLFLFLVLIFSSGEIGGYVKVGVL